MSSWQLPVFIEEVLCACLDSSTNVLAIESLQESLYSCFHIRSLTLLPFIQSSNFPSVFLVVV
jgi:hypothetical protein